MKKIYNLNLFYFLLFNYVYATLPQRKFSTAVYHNHTIHLIGGISPTGQIHHPALHFQFQNLSIDAPASPSIYGHTTTLYNHTFIHTTSRRHHTAVLSNHTLYLIGGEPGPQPSIAIHLPTSNLTTFDTSHMAGHVSFLQGPYLMISCFGHEAGIPLIGCLRLDLRSGLQTRLRPTLDWPSPRVFASLTEIGQDRYLLLGGEWKGRALGEVWELEAGRMRWTRRGEIKGGRSGHAAVWVNDRLVVLGDGPPIQVRLGSSLEKRQVSSQEIGQGSKGIRPGVIVAIVLVGLLIVLLVVLYSVWRRKRNVGCRAIRFSQALPEKHQDRTVDLPVESRISTLSLGPEFRFSPDQYRSELPRIQEDGLVESSKISLKDLLSRPEQVRRSGLVRSRPQFLQPPPSPMSISSKSVTSLQWVGFDDRMDYRSSAGQSSLHLAVKNSQRAHSYYSDSSAQSTPKSPLFPYQVRDSTVRYNDQKVQLDS